MLPEKRKSSGKKKAILKPRFDEQSKPQSKSFAKITPNSQKTDFRIDFVNLEFMESLVHELAQTLLPYREPIPHFMTRFPHRLEGCLSVIEQPEYFNNDPILQLANLIYRLIKNHPFQNGNKRIALTTLVVVIETNLGTSKQFIKDFIKFVSKGGMTAIFLKQIANSKPHEKDKMVKSIYNFIIPSLSF